MLAPAAERCVGRSKTQAGGWHRHRAVRRLLQTRGTMTARCRSVIAILLLAARLGSPTGDAHTSGKVYRVGVLIAGGTGPNPAGPNPGLSEFDAFTHQLRELGYILGQNLVIDSRGAEGKY